MELREEAWSPGPLDSEDQQMASHENPGEVASVILQPTPLPFHQAGETILCDFGVAELLSFSLQEPHPHS